MLFGDKSSFQIADFFYSSEFQNMLHTQKIGVFGQYIARAYFVDKGFEVIAENYYVRAGEIDLVATKDGRVHVIEVKTRTSEAKGEAQTSIHYFKQLSLKRSGIQFMSDKDWLYKKPWQIDGLAVVIDKSNKKLKVRYYPNIIEDSLL